MQAYGGDRLRIGEDGRILLSCRAPKRWIPRKEKTTTSVEHPGTAVLWDDAYYEVLSALEIPGGVRYELAPWREEHAIRTADRYDDASEVRRQAAYRKEVHRRRTTAVSFLWNIFAGMLPARVQEQLESEYGVEAFRITARSLILSVAVIVVLLRYIVQQYTTTGGVPGVGIGIANVLFMETMIRFRVAWGQRQACGSIAGFILYTVAYVLTPRGWLLAPWEPPQDNPSLTFVPPSEGRQLRDALIMRSSYATLLSQEEQRRLQEWYGFQYREHAYGIAWVILFFSSAGVFTSIQTLKSGFRFTAFASLVCAGYLAVEQMLRLRGFSARPTPSVLAVVARPFLSRFLRVRPAVALDVSESAGLRHDPESPRPLRDVYDGPSEPFEQRKGKSGED